MLEQSGGAEICGEYGKHYQGKNKDRQPVRKWLQHCRNTIKDWRATRHGVMRYLLAIASITEIIKSNTIEVDSYHSSNSGRNHIILVKQQVTIVTADSTWIKTHPTNTHKRLEVIRLGASVTGSIIKSTHGKLSIWVTANRTAHIRLYQKSARKLVTIKHFSRNISNQNRLLLLFIEALQIASWQVYRKEQLNIQRKRETT